MNQRQEKVANAVITRNKKGSTIKTMANLLGLDSDYLIGRLLIEGRFTDATYLMRDNSRLWKQKAQEFLELFFTGKIISVKDDSLMDALSIVPYKKNISSLFEKKKYDYDILGKINDVFQKTRSKEAKKKIATLILLNFHKNRDSHETYLRGVSSELKKILTSNDIDLILEEITRLGRYDYSEAKKVAEILEYKDACEKIYLSIKERAITHRDPLLGFMVFECEELQNRFEEIPVDYWVEAPVPLDYIEKKIPGITVGQLEQRISFLIKNNAKLYLIISTAKKIGRKITINELNAYIENNPGIISAVHKEEYIDFTDDQFLVVMKSQSRFTEPSQLRWFWGEYSLENNKTLKRIYDERPKDVNAVWEAILAALFASDFKDESAVILHLLKDIGRSMTEKERSLYVEKIFGLW